MGRRLELDMPRRVRRRRVPPAYSTPRVRVVPREVAVRKRRVVRDNPFLTDIDNDTLFFDFRPRRRGESAGQYRLRRAAASPAQLVRSPVESSEPEEIEITAGAVSYYVPTGLHGFFDDFRDDFDEAVNRRPRPSLPPDFESPWTDTNSPDDPEWQGDDVCTKNGVDLQRRYGACERIIVRVSNRETFERTYWSKPRYKSSVDGTCTYCDSARCEDVVDLGPPYPSECNVDVIRTAPPLSRSERSTLCHLVRTDPAAVGATGNALLPPLIERMEAEGLTIEDVCGTLINVAGFIFGEGGGRFTFQWNSDLGQWDIPAGQKEAVMDLLLAGAVTLESDGSGFRLGAGQLGFESTFGPMEKDGEAATFWDRRVSGERPFLEVETDVPGQWALYINIVTAAGKPRARNDSKEFDLKTMSIELRRVPDDPWWNAVLAGVNKIAGPVLTTIVDIGRDIVDLIREIPEFLQAAIDMACAAARSELAPLAATAASGGVVTQEQVDAILAQFCSPDDDGRDDPPDTTPRKSNALKIALAIGIPVAAGGLFLAFRR